MRAKDKLDLTSLNNLFENDSWHNIYRVGAKVLGGAGEGFAATAFVLTSLTILGITVASLAELIATSTAVLLFMIMGGGIAIYQVLKERAKNKQLKAEFDSKLDDLKRTVVQLGLDYQLLEEAKQNLTQQIAHLEGLAERAGGELHDETESRRIEQKLSEERADLRRIEQTKEDTLSKLKIILAVFSGNINTEKLNQLFGAGNGVTTSDAIRDYAQGKHLIADNHYPKLVLGIKAISYKLNTPLPDTDHARKIETDFSRAAHKEKEKTTGIVKGLFIGLAGMAGFFGGLGMSTAVAGLALGGTAALLAAGWPVLAPVLAVGVIGAVGAMIYYNHVKKNEARKQQRVDKANTQVTAMTDLLSKQNNQSSALVNEVNQKYEHSLREDEVRLADPQADFERYSKSLQRNAEKLASLKTEYDHFPQRRVDDLRSEHDKAKEIVNSTNQAQILVQDLRTRVHSIAVKASSEERKLALLAKIQQLEENVASMHKQAEEMQLQVDRKLHAQQQGSRLAPPTTEAKPMQPPLRVGTAVNEQRLSRSDSEKPTDPAEHQKV